jgi:catechol 2,3-dioxygenase-like lactoylglutathione lyase family enzyme
MPDLGLTHVALTARDLDASIAFYAKYAGMAVVHRRAREGVRSVWLSDHTRPFVIVLVEAAGQQDHPLGPFGHLGVACASREEIDRLYDEACREGRPTRAPDRTSRISCIKARGVALKATEQPVDTGNAAGKAFLDMLGVFDEFETNLRRERQLEGISAAKERGVYKGRKPSIDAVEVLRLRREEKLGPAAIARRLGIGRASVYRVLDKHATVVRTNRGVDANQA